MSLRSLGFRLLERTRVAQVVRRVVDVRRQEQRPGDLTLAPGARLGPSAVIRNGYGERERISVGELSLIDGELLVHGYGGRLAIGRSCYVGPGTRIWSGEEVRIGDHVFIAHNVTITDTNAHSIDWAERAREYQTRVVEGRVFGKGSIETAPVIIGDHAWINFGVGVLKGVTIGERSIVGAMSLVLNDVPPDCLVAGVPARVIKKLV